MTETDLKDLSIRLEAIIETAIDGIITIDASGVIESLNLSAGRIFQYDKKEIIGKNVNVLMPEPHKSRHDRYISKYLSTKVPKIIGIGREVEGRRKDGSTFPFRLAVSEVVLNDRVIFAGIVHDLTEFKKVQDHIVRLNEELEQKVDQRTEELEKVVNRLLKTNSLLNREVAERKEVERKLKEQESDLRIALGKERELSELKSRFVSMASHEFRTPLSTILSSAAIISRYKTEDDHVRREKHINRIKSAVSNLTGILNDFLSLSKLEEGVTEVNIEQVDMREMCSHIEGELEGILKNGQYINHQYSGDVPVIQTDKRVLKNILFNIISNSIKYSDEESRIDCDIRSEEHGLKIMIKDEGIGIPEGDQKHLFGRFFRAKNAENIQGTGLGLHIVKRYIDLLGGNISFESEEGVGTTFYIDIPKLNP